MLPRVHKPKETKGEKWGESSPESRTVKSMRPSTNIEREASSQHESRKCTED
jgi:hypothetical protein